MHAVWDLWAGYECSLSIFFTHPSMMGKSLGGFAENHVQSSRAQLYLAGFLCVHPGN